MCAHKYTYIHTTFIIIYKLDVYIYRIRYSRHNDIHIRTYKYIYNENNAMVFATLDSLQGKKVFKH